MPSIFHRSRRNSAKDLPRVRSFTAGRDLSPRRPHLRHTSLRSGDETNVASSTGVFPTQEFTRTYAFRGHPPSTDMRMVRRFHDRCPTSGTGPSTARGGSLSQDNRPNPRTPSGNGFPPDLTDCQGVLVQAPMPSVLRCWISPGWHIGLSVDEFGDWPRLDDCGPGLGGIAGALVACHHRPGRVSVCGYLVDTWCLGVKNALGPRLMNDRRLPRIRERFFAAFDADPVPAPIELVRHLVWGAVGTAHGVGI